jgi:hypothetical protein
MRARFNGNTKLSIQIQDSAINNYFMLNNFGAKIPSLCTNEKTLVKNLINLLFFLYLSHNQPEF